MIGKKFLIVDDDKDDSELFIEALSSLGTVNQCYCANDGKDALEKLNDKKSERPDIIFLDINMPVMDGWECLNKLKSEQLYKDIPVIIYTTSSLHKDRVQARDLGANCFVTKMQDFRKLKKMLEIVVTEMERNSIDTICDSIYKNLSMN